MYESILQFILLAAGLAASLLLFISLKREVHRNAQQQSARLTEMQSRLEQADSQQTAAAFGLAPPRAGFNSHLRVHALRLLRRGETETHVAAALGVPQREVALLVRVQSMAAGAPRTTPDRY
jgi:hypothetical protein